MPDPVTFTSASARHGLPLLFAGQAQKEFFVNQAHVLADILLHPAIEGVADTPPGTPAEGECWLIGPGAAGAWTGEAGKIAGWQAGTWIFAAPRDGMAAFDRAAGQTIRHAGGEWLRAEAPAEPTGGATVDEEARTAIAGLIAALIAGGILPGD